MYHFILSCMTSGNVLLSPVLLPTWRRVNRSHLKEVPQNKKSIKLLEQCLAWPRFSFSSPSLQSYGNHYRNI